MDKNILIMRVNNKIQFHTKMYETLYKQLMTPRMIKIRKELMEQRILLYNLTNEQIIKDKEFIEYMNNLDKENYKYCQEKIY